MRLTRAYERVHSALGHCVILSIRLIRVVEVIYEAATCGDQVASALSFRPFRILRERDLTSRVSALDRELLLLLFAQQASLYLGDALLEVGIRGSGEDGRLLRRQRIDSCRRRPMSG